MPGVCKRPPATKGIKRNLFGGTRILSRLFLLSVLGLVAGSFFPGAASEAHAAQITAALIPEYDYGAGTFSGTKFIEITYEPQSDLARKFNGKTERVDFSVSANASKDTLALVDLLNRQLSTEINSPVQLDSANVTYSATLKGKEDRISISYKVDVAAFLSGYVMQSNNNKTEMIIDANWRGLWLQGPVIVQTDRYGPFDVNQPIGLLQVIEKNLAQGLMLDDGSEKIFTDPLMDFRQVREVPLNRWHQLFDPTVSQVGVEGMLIKGTGKAKVLSVYSLGECSFREGCPEPREMDASLTFNQAPIKIHMSVPKPNAQIQVAGYTTIQKNGSDEIMFVNLETASQAPNAFPLQVLLVLGGMMGSIAIVVLFKARR